MIGWVRLLRFAALVRGSGMGPRQFFSYLRHFPKMVRLYVRLFRDPRVPIRLKLYCCLGLLYMVSPVDAVPDVLLPIIGFGDDILLLYWVFRKLVHDSPPEVVRKHVEEIEGRVIPIQAWEPERQAGNDRDAS